MQDHLAEAAPGKTTISQLFYRSFILAKNWSLFWPRNSPRVAIGAGFSAAILKMFDEDEEFEAGGGRFTGGEERLLDVGGEGLFLEEEKEDKFKVGRGRYCTRENQGERRQV